MEHVLKVYTEIKSLLKDVNTNEQNLTEQVKKNTESVLIYKSFLEKIIEEYHNVCKNIYKE